MDTPRKIILDSDPGIDDALAILLALASDQVHLEGVTVVHGNCSAPQGVVNALSILELAGAEDVPVFQGFERPLVNPPLFAPETHGSSGLGYAELPAPARAEEEEHAVDFLIRKLLSAPGEITVVAVGPLTNLAVAFRKEPAAAQAVREVISMGGAIKHGGNTTPLAEFNVYADPHAAHMVYHTGVPLRLVPLDVTYQCVLTQTDVDRLQQLASPISAFIADATRYYMEFHDSYQGVKGCVINDPLALALVYREQLCRYRDLYVNVDISGGVSTGKTYGDFYRMEEKPANCQVALEVNPREFIEEFVEGMEKLIQSKEVN
jgi:purine nucleosidase